MEGKSPAQIYALVFGTVLVAAGILGFFYSSAFGTPGERDAVLGILDVNGWHNVVHILTGALGLAVAASYGGARGYAVGFGVVYLLVTIIGTIDGDSIFGLLEINAADNALHAVIALAGLAAGLASAPAGAGSRTRTA
jgi:hypothetical protein